MEQIKCQATFCDKPAIAKLKLSWHDKEVFYCASHIEGAINYSIPSEKVESLHFLEGVLK